MGYMKSMMENDYKEYEGKVTLKELKDFVRFACRVKGQSLLDWFWCMLSELFNFDCEDVDSHELINAEFDYKIAKELIKDIKVHTIDGSRTYTWCLSDGSTISSKDIPESMLKDIEKDIEFPLTEESLKDLYVSSMWGIGFSFAPEIEDVCLEWYNVRLLECYWEYAGNVLDDEAFIIVKQTSPDDVIWVEA